MCGCFCLLAGLKAVKDYYEFLKSGDFVFETDEYIIYHQKPRLEIPNDSIFPMQYAPIIANNDRRVSLIEARWGLIPYWAKDESIARKTYNARIESIAEKPSFKYALKQRRCLIPFTGYYEWSKDKIKHLFANENNSIKSFAGLYEIWGVENLVTFTIITQPANEVTSLIHHRMPVILDETEAINWLQLG